MEKIIIIGSGGHATSCIDVIQNENKFQIFGIVTKDKKIKKLLNYNVVGYDDDFNVLSKKIPNAFIGIGQIKDYQKRLFYYQKLLKLNFKLPSILSPQSYISHNSLIGFGTIIMNGAVINSNVKIGNNNIINSKALIEHDVVIGNNCHISTGVIINGNVKVGNNIFIGSGSIIFNDVNISDNSIIPAGSIITNNFNN